MLRRIARPALGAALGLVVIAQFYQPARSNPATDPAASFEAVARPPAHVASIVKRACGDCHSNETEWRWYSKVAPASWLVAHDVQEGRAHLNFSEWGRFGPEMARIRLRAICEQVRGGEMPVWYYLPLHPSAKLAPAEISALCAPSLRGSGD